MLLAQLTDLCQLLAPVGLWSCSIACSVTWFAVCSVNGLLLLVSCVSAVWAPPQSVLLDDLLPALARVGTRMTVFSWQLLGCRSPVRWSVSFCHFLTPACLRVGRAKRCLVFPLSPLLLVSWLMLSARARVVVHVIIPCRLRVWPG